MIGPASEAPRPEADSPLSESRQTLRQLLLPRTRGAAEQAPEFIPRSRTMRALMHPDQRWVWTAGIAVASLMLPRMMAARRVGTVLSAYAAIRRAIDLTRPR